jgi:hypothetical protein
MTPTPRAMTASPRRPLAPTTGAIGSHHHRSSRIRSCNYRVAVIPDCALR